MTAFDILAKAADESGWNTRTMLFVVLDYLEDSFWNGLSSPKEFMDYIENRIEEDKELSIELDKEFI